MSSTPCADQPPPVPIRRNAPPPSAQPRMLAILAVAGIAFIHIAAAPDAQRAAPYLLGLYLALAAAAVPLICALLFWESARVWTLTAVYALAPLAGYLWSRGIGLPGDSDDFGDWMNSLGIASLFVESSLLAVSLVYLARLPHRQLAPPNDRSTQRSHMSIPLSVRRATLAAVVIALVASVALVARPLPASAAGATAASTQVLHLSARANMVLRFNTSRLRARRGRITIIMTNPSNAGMDHGIALQGHGVNKTGPIVAPGHRSVITVVLRRRGNYQYFCPVPGHRQAGMSGTLTVR